MKVWNKVLLASFIGLLVAGCDDSSKVDANLDKAKDSAEQMKDAAQKKADDLTDKAKATAVQAQRLFGDPDYLLHVIARDLPAFQQLYDEKLSALPGVQRLSSTLVMKTVVPERSFLPLGK